MEKNGHRLIEGDKIIFKYHYQAGGEEEIEQGDVVWVDYESKRAGVIFLRGYKSLTETVKMHNILAVYDKTHQQPSIKIDVFSGPSFDWRDKENL